MTNQEASSNKRDRVAYSLTRMGKLHGAMQLVEEENGAGTASLVTADGREIRKVDFDSKGDVTMQIDYNYDGDRCVGWAVRRANEDIVRSYVLKDGTLWEYGPDGELISKAPWK